MDLKLKYIEWKQKSATNRVYPGVELISFHLPKTGGVSFRDVLKKHYSKDLQLIYSRGILKNINNQKPIWVPENTKALH